MTRGAKTNKTRARATTQTARLTARWEMKASVRRRLLLQSSVGRDGNAEAACREGVLRAKASMTKTKPLPPVPGARRTAPWLRRGTTRGGAHGTRVRCDSVGGRVVVMRGENSAGGLQIRTRIENNPSSDPRPHIRHTPPEPESPLVKDSECQRTMRMYNLWAAAPRTAAPKLTVLPHARPTRSAKTSHPKIHCFPVLQSLGAHEQNTDLHTSALAPARILRPREKSLPHPAHTPQNTKHVRTARYRGLSEKWQESKRTSENARMEILCINSPGSWVGAPKKKAARTQEQKPIEMKAAKNRRSKKTNEKRKSDGKTRTPNPPHRQ
ncbi:hypothetical protein C8R45DRAFT_929603 [Mycena sanguinolenta]|nr:hypothetical protein C8R45DRAFT_929603 [Mycena sanguinolenta]